MKNIKQLQQIVNETDRQLGGVDYQNRDQAIEIALDKLMSEPQLLREIITDAINKRANDNVARYIAQILKQA